jgi:hypothetical protein
MSMVISDMLDVPDMTTSNWFKHSAEKLVKKTRNAHSKCLHFESSQIGKNEAEKQKLRSWKKNCGFCKVLKRNRTSKENGQEGSVSDNEKQPSCHRITKKQREMPPDPVSSPDQQSQSWGQSILALFKIDWKSSRLPWKMM